MMSRVYCRARRCGISAIWKKMPRKIFVAASNEAQKKTNPRISTIFLNKMSENNTDLTAAL